MHTLTCVLHPPSPRWRPAPRSNVWTCYNRIQCVDILHYVFHNVSQHSHQLYFEPEALLVAIWQCALPGGFGIGRPKPQKMFAPSARIAQITLGGLARNTITKNVSLHCVNILIRLCAEIVSSYLPKFPERSWTTHVLSSAVWANQQSNIRAHNKL